MSTIKLPQSGVKQLTLAVLAVLSVTFAVALYLTHPWWTLGLAILGASIALRYLLHHMTLARWIRITGLERLIWIPEFNRSGYLSGAPAPPRQLALHPFIPSFADFSNGSEFWFNFRTWMMATSRSGDADAAAEFRDAGYTRMAVPTYFYNQSAWRLVPAMIYVPVLSVLIALGGVIASVAFGQVLGLSIIALGIIVGCVIWRYDSRSAHTRQGRIVSLFVTACSMAGTVLWLVHLNAIWVLGVVILEGLFLYWRISRLKSGAMQSLVHLMFFTPVLLILGAGVFTLLVMVHQEVAAIIPGVAGLLIVALVERWQWMFMNWYSNGIYMPGDEIKLVWFNGLIYKGQIQAEPQVIEGTSSTYERRPGAPVQPVKPWFIPWLLLARSRIGTIAFLTASGWSTLHMAPHPEEFLREILQPLGKAFEHNQGEIPELLKSANRLNSQLLSAVQAHGAGEGRDPLSDTQPLPRIR